MCFPPGRGESGWRRTLSWGTRSIKTNTQTGPEKVKNNLFFICLEKVANCFVLLSFFAFLHRELQQRRLPEHELTYKRVQKAFPHK